jgi:hypothetical protein
MCESLRRAKTKHRFPEKGSRQQSTTVLSSQAIAVRPGEQSLRIFSVRRSLQVSHNGSKKSQRLWGSLNTNFDARVCLLLLNHNR